MNSLSYLPSKETDNYGNWHWKVGNPGVSNNIPQMRSDGFQPYFCPGGSNAVPYYLGLNGSTSQQTAVSRPPVHSAYKKVLHEKLHGKGFVDELADIGSNKPLMDNLIKEGTNIGNLFKGVVGFNPFEIGMRIGEPIGHAIGHYHYKKKGRKTKGKGLESFIDHERAMASGNLAELSRIGNLKKLPPGFAPPGFARRGPGSMTEQQKARAEMFGTQAPGSGMGGRYDKFMNGGDLQRMEPFQPQDSRTFRIPRTEQEYPQAIKDKIMEMRERLKNRTPAEKEQDRKLRMEAREKNKPSAMYRNSKRYKEIKYPKEKEAIDRLLDKMDRGEPLNFIERESLLSYR